MGGNATAVLYGVLMVAVIVAVDFLFFRDRFWGRLMVNIGIVLVFAAFYLEIRSARQPRDVRSTAESRLGQWQAWRIAAPLVRIDIPAEPGRRLRTRLVSQPQGPGIELGRRCRLFVRIFPAGLAHDFLLVNPHRLRFKLPLDLAQRFLDLEGCGISFGSPRSFFSIEPPGFSLGF